MNVLAPVTFVGRVTLYTLTFVGGIGLLLRDAAVRVKTGLFTGRGHRLGRANLWQQMVRVGVRSIGIISLVVFCIGAILSLQMQPILKEYGAVGKIADLIGIAMLRELGPLVAAITLTGFAGASIAAEIGTMNVSEELEALETSAIDPVRFLVVPRVLATAVMMVCLAVVADLMGVAGGLVVSSTMFKIAPESYLNATFAAVKTRDFVSGLVKSAFFGTALSSIACYLGMNVKGGAQGVGDATTKTVVYTIVALTFIDLGFTAVFYYLGF